MLTLAKSLTTASSSTTYSSYSKTYLVKGVLKTVFGAAVAMGVLGAGQAHALVVTVNGQDWDVTTFYGTYIDNSTKFNTETPVNGGVMPWFGIGATETLDLLADVFATAVGGRLGFPNGPLAANEPPTGGPFFAWQVTSNPTVNDVTLVGRYISVSNCVPLGDPADCGLDRGLVNDRTEVTWAQATPVPGPLPVLGAAAAFGFSRKLRKRIKTSTNPARSDSSLCT
jgi:hypothetical protein